MTNETTSYADTIARMQQAFRAFLTIAITVPEEHIAWALESVNQQPYPDHATPLGKLHERERLRRIVALFDSTTRELRLLFPEGIEG